MDSSDSEKLEKAERFLNSMGYVYFDGKWTPRENTSYCSQHYQLTQLAQQQDPSLRGYQRMAAQGESAAFGHCGFVDPRWRYAGN